MKASKPLFRSQEDVTFILPARDVSAGHDASAATLAILGSRPAYTGTLTTPDRHRGVYVVEGTKADGMTIASLMWRYGFRGTLMATPLGLWLVSSQGPGLLRGVRLRTKQPWYVRYGLVDAELPR